MEFVGVDMWASATSFVKLCYELVRCVTITKHAKPQTNWSPHLLVAAAKALKPYTILCENINVNNIETWTISHQYKKY